MNPYWLRVAVFDVGIGCLILIVTCAPMLTSTMFAATVGSLGRWYWPRWQLGVVAGVWLGVNAAILLLGLENLNRRHHPLRAGGGEQYWEWMAITSGVGGTVALILSRWSARWFDQAETFWLIGFRENSWRWLRWKSIRVISVAAMAAAAMCWITIRKDSLEYAAEELRFRPQYEPIREKLKPYEAHVGWTRQGLNLSVQRALGLSSEALKRIDESPLPFVELDVHFTKYVQDEDLVRAARQLKTIERIELHHTSLSDACLTSLAECPALKRLSISECPAITSQGCRHLSGLRPDVAIDYSSPGQVVQRFGP